MILYNYRLNPGNRKTGGSVRDRIKTNEEGDT